MKIFKNEILALSFILLISSSCQHDLKDETLPPITQTGQNTFGCLINGNVWINEGMTGSSGGNFWAFVTSNYFKMTAIRRNSNPTTIYQSFGFDIESPIHVGKYILNKGTQYAGFEDDITHCPYKTDSISSLQTLEITKYDSINHIIAGTFNFQAMKKSSVQNTYNCDSTINITEGRFDLKYEY